MLQVMQKERTARYWMRDIEVDSDKHVHASTVHALLGCVCNDCEVDVTVAL
jgi:hypothetical protein